MPALNVLNPLNLSSPLNYGRAIFSPCLPSLSTHLGGRTLWNLGTYSNITEASFGQEYVGHGSLGAAGPTPIYPALQVYQGRVCHYYGGQSNALGWAHIAYANDRLNSNDSQSVAFWINMGGRTEQSTAYIFCNGYDGPRQQLSVDFYAGDNRVALTWLSNPLVLASTALPTTGWTHVTCVKRRNSDNTYEGYIYYNAVLVGSYGPGATGTSQGGLLAGCTTTWGGNRLVGVGLGYTFQGYLSDYSFWLRDLSYDEVKYNYWASLAGYPFELNWINPDIGLQQSALLKLMEYGLYTSNTGRLST